MKGLRAPVESTPRHSALRSEANLPFKAGQPVRVLGSMGEIADATFRGLSYSGKPKIYSVSLKVPTGIAKHPYRKAIWYLPASRFVL